MGRLCLTDLCRLQRFAKLFLVTLIFLFVNCLLDLRFGDAEPPNTNPPWKEKRIPLTETSPKVGLLSRNVPFPSQKVSNTLLISSPPKLAFNSDVSKRLTFKRGLSSNVKFDRGSQNRAKSENSVEISGVKSFPSDFVQQRNQGYVIHMSAKVLENTKLGRERKIGAKIEVSHTAPPEPHTPINDTYFLPRSSVVNDFDFQYFSQPECSELFLLILTCSKHEHFQYRRAIRDTWGSIGLYHKRIKLVFLLGQHDDHYWNTNIRKEANNLRDILIINTRESYTNLTLKVMAGLNWASTECPAQYILKSDEDMVINVPFLAKLLKLRPIENSILGSVNYEAPVMRSNKWKVDKAVYPYSIYPPYVSGNSYVISMDAALKILRTFRYMPIINVEDAFITGVLARVAGVKLIADARFTYWGTPMITVCEFVQNKMISGTHMTPKILYRMWKAISKRKCAV